MLVFGFFILDFAAAIRRPKPAGKQRKITDFFPGELSMKRLRSQIFPGKVGVFSAFLDAWETLGSRPYSSPQNNHPIG